MMGHSWNERGGVGSVQVWFMCPAAVTPLAHVSFAASATLLAPCSQLLQMCLLGPHQHSLPLCKKTGGQHSGLHTLCPSFISLVSLVAGASACTPCNNYSCSTGTMQIAGWRCVELEGLRGSLGSCYSQVRNSGLQKQLFKV